MPRLFRSPPWVVLLLHHSIHRSSHLTANLPSNRKPQQHGRAWLWPPDASSLVGRRFARTLRSLLHSWGQAAKRVSKVINMGTTLLHGCYTKDLTAIQVALR